MVIAQRKMQQVETRGKQTCAFFSIFSQQCKAKGIKHTRGAIQGNEQQG